MSKFSGKCDVYDSLIMIHNFSEEELINNVTIYVGHNKEPLKLTSAKDLIPYYPHIVSIGCYNNQERKSQITISSRSFVDYEEEQRLTFILQDVLRIYNRCKRKKIEFNVEDVVKELCFDNYAKKEITEIASRVKEKGKKATIEGIHLPYFDYHRQLLVDEMLENGLNPADYGYERFLKK